MPNWEIRFIRDAFASRLLKNPQVCSTRCDYEGKTEVLAGVLCGSWVVGSTGKGFGYGMCLAAGTTKRK